MLLLLLSMMLMLITMLLRMLMMMICVFQVHTVGACAAQNDVNICVSSISLSVIVPPVNNQSTLNSTSRYYAE